MRKIEKEEEQISYDEPDKKIYHLCIVNLVIGTLYCAKGNYEFGISRVIKSLEPYKQKVSLKNKIRGGHGVIAFLSKMLVAAICEINWANSCLVDKC